MAKLKISNFKINGPIVFSVKAHSNDNFSEDFVIDAKSDENEYKTIDLIREKFKKTEEIELTNSSLYTTSNLKSISSFNNSSVYVLILDETAPTNYKTKVTVGEGSYVKVADPTKYTIGEITLYRDSLLHFVGSSKKMYHIQTPSSQKDSLEIKDVYKEVKFCEFLARKSYSLQSPDVLLSDLDAFKFYAQNKKVVDLLLFQNNNVLGVAAPEVLIANLEKVVAKNFVRFELICNNTKKAWEESILPKDIIELVALHIIGKCDYNPNDFKQIAGDGVLEVEDWC